MSRFDLGPGPNDGLGEWVRCDHCDSTGKQEGPGGLEECCHCRGRGELWLDDSDVDQAEAAPPIRTAGYRIVGGEGEPDYGGTVGADGNVYSDADPCL